MKVGIVGCAYVGSTTACALAMQGAGCEAVFVDKNRDPAIAQADDLHHRVPFAKPFEAHPGDYDDLKDRKVVIICPGIGEKPGETRLQLLQRNAAVSGPITSGPTWNPKQT